MNYFALQSPPDARPADPKEWTPQEKRDALVKVLNSWDNRELQRIVEDSIWSKQGWIDLIMENDFLADEIDTILSEAGVMELPVLCGGTLRPADERRAYQQAMQGQ